MTTVATLGRCSGVAEWLDCWFGLLVGLTSASRPRPASDSRLLVLSRHLGSQLAVETQQKAEEEEQCEAVERGLAR